MALCKFVTSKLRDAKTGYMRRLIPYNKNEFWKAVKYLTKRQSPPAILSHNGTVASTSLEKASMLNTFFGDCLNHCVSPLDFQDYGSIGTLFLLP